MGQTPFQGTLNELNIIFRTSNELEHVQLFVIELKHPIFGFEQTNIEHPT